MVSHRLAIPTCMKGIDVADSTAGARRKVRFRGVAQEARVADRPYLMALYADPCAYCGEPGGYVDHIDAGSRGGSDHWTNYTAACSGCNSRKRSSSLIGYLAWLRYEPERRMIEHLQAQLRALRNLGTARVAV